MELDEGSDASAYAELRRSLDSTVSEVEAHTTARRLYGEADTLIVNYGKDGTVNRLPAWVSVGYVERKDLADHPLFVRLAKLKKPGEDEDLPLIVFSETPDIHVRTRNLRALRFRDQAGDISLITDYGMNPLLDDPKYLTLAAELIKGIGEQSAEIVTAEQSAKDARRRRVARTGKAIRRYMNDETALPGRSDFETYGERRKFTLGACTLALALVYSHLPFGHVDAKIGPVAMPQPIELIVDWDNRTDHVAQGFSQPKDALGVKIGDKELRLPLLDSYDTKGVPDATYNNGSTGVESDDEELSKPGLYKVDFGSSTTHGRCVTVNGNYRSGKSSVFTQDIATAENMRISVNNAKELQACVVEDGKPDIKGSFYIWQNK